MTSKPSDHARQSYEQLAELEQLKKLQGVNELRRDSNPEGINQYSEGGGEHDEAKELHDHVVSSFQSKFPGAKIEHSYDGEEETHNVTVSHQLDPKTGEPRVGGKKLRYKMQIGTDDDVMHFTSPGKSPVIFDLPPMKE